MKIYSNILEMVGNTPMLELKNLDTGPCQLFAKLELANPTSSVKDRIAVTMIEEAERRGDIRPGDTLVEATAGNTGMGLALVAAQKGYHLVLVLPDKMSQEKVFNCKAMGAEVIITRSDVGKGHPEYYQDVAQRIGQERGAYYINQFGNPDNCKSHETTTGPEIWQQMEGKVDAVVVGVGSSGTITGVGHYLKRVNPGVEIVLADPEGSILANYVKTGEIGESGGWLVEGIGEDFIPSIADISVADVAYTIPDKEAFLTGRELLQKEGLMAGASSGTLLAAALKYCRAQNKPKRVVTLAADTGNRYLSKMYNDYWMIEQDFIERKSFGDLRDLVSRLHEERTTVTVGPRDAVTTAHNRMRNHGYSQLPVVDGDTLLGGVTEADLIQAVTTSEAGFAAEVESVMNRNFPSIEVSRSWDTLKSRLEIDPALAVVDGSQFHGLITRTDYLNYLRREEHV